VTPLEPLEPISIGGFDSQPIDMNTFGGPPVSVSVNRESLFGNSQSSTGPGIQLATPARDPDAEKKEKTDYLNKLQRLESKGIAVSRRYTMDNTLEEIKQEYSRLVDSRNLESSIKFQRSTLLTCVTGLEFLNQKFNPLDVNLDGWSESVNENQDDFDEIFEELYDKYKDRSKVAPEIRLVMTLGISAAMCHVTNTFFKSKMPGMDDILKRNPELARQFAQAAATQAVGPGFANFVSMGMPQGQQQQQQQMRPEPEAFVQQNNSENWNPNVERAPPSPPVQTARR
jgi:hypothetical protein